ncbi:MAG TPA: glycosyltransferase [Candidatus Aquabacterium excrementipullorum]|nr:glycosyltransferase [Candidatus Aquabacterium excrementipullorum]
MKVLHVESGMHLYGGALQVVFLSRGLQRLGVENVLACPEGSAIAEASAQGGVAVRALPMGGDADVGLVARLRRLIATEKPDLIHLHSRRGADIWGGVAGRLSGIPVVLSRRVDNTESKWAVALKYRLYDRVVAISQGIQAVLASEGVPAGKLRCVPSAVDTEQYWPDTSGLDWFRQEFQLAPGQLAVGMVAQLIPRKGHQTLLDALPEVVKAHPGLKVLLFGQGPEAPRLEQRIAASPLLKTHVSLVGFRKDLQRVLPCLDLVVHPAFMEGLGVSLLQAAACGVPLVGGRAGGIPEIVRPGINGELIEPGDAAALAAAMTALLSSTEQRQAYGRAGRELVMSHFSIESMVRGNLAVYRELVG